MDFKIVNYRNKLPRGRTPSEGWVFDIEFPDMGLKIKNFRLCRLEKSWRLISPLSAETTDDTTLMNEVVKRFNSLDLPSSI